MFRDRSPEKDAISMFRNKLLRTTAFALGLAGMLSNTLAVTAAQAQTSPTLTLAQKIALLRQNVKYVFVIFAENRSFDYYFGTFPGANGLFSAPAGFTPANQTASWNQPIVDVFSSGPVASATTTMTPFLAPQAVTNANQDLVQIYPADVVSVSHSHQGIGNSMDFDGASGVAANDRYALTQESLTTTSPGGAIVKSTGAAPTSITLAQKQAGEQAIAHVDCDTVPFLWQWAKNFVLFDNFHQGIVGPSTPNALEVLAGQVGQTQWALHNSEGASITGNTTAAGAFGASYNGPSTNTDAYVPLIADAGPYPGSAKDTNLVKPPYNSDESNTNPALNMTYASLPLSFMGSNIIQIISQDPNPAADLLDVEKDIFSIAAFNQPVNWGWFQQGFDSNDAADANGDSVSTNASTVDTPTGGYVLHHNAPQYFAYIADNPTELKNNMHGNADFFTAIANQTLGSGGVFYLRGGLNNNPENGHSALVPVVPRTTEQIAFAGNDDHPGNSDSQIAEAMAADAIDAIANSPYWANAAIIITYDETDGAYDHAQPQVISMMADGTPLEGGPRVPTIVISPFAAAGTISHLYSEHGSIIKLIDDVFGLTPLASLPNEVAGRAAGAASAATLNQTNLEPADDPNNGIGDLTEAFDYAILQGTKPPLSSSLATFTPTQIATLPHLATSSGATNGACAAIGILPTDYESQEAYASGQPIDPAPSDYNPRPGTAPGTPTAATWTP
jgi:phospholipase C